MAAASRSTRIPVQVLVWSEDTGEDDALAIAEVVGLSASRRAGAGVAAQAACLAAAAVLLADEDEVMRLAQIAGVQVGEVTLVLPPPTDQAWTGELRQTLPAAAWRGGGLWQALIPGLGLAAIGDGKETAFANLADAARVALKDRSGMSVLALLARAAGMRLSTSRQALEVPRTTRRGPDRGVLTLRQLTTDVPPLMVPLVGLDLPLDRLRRHLLATPRRHVLLVGPDGSGRSSLVRRLQLAAGWEGVPLPPASAPAAKDEDKADDADDDTGPLLGRSPGGRPWWAVDAVQVIAAGEPFITWDDALDALFTVAAEHDGVLHLGRLATWRMGASSSDRRTMLDHFAGAMARGRCSLVAECTADELARLEALCPRTIARFQRVEVPAADAAQVAAVLAAHAVGGPDVPAVDAAAQAVIADLHRRFARYSPSPARAVEFLRRLQLDQRATEAGTAISTAQVYAAFARQSGLPALLLDPGVRLRPADLHAALARAVLGQEPAVTAVVDALVLIRAGMARPGRPLATLLFAGPSGVGKTELAKAIAGLLFNDRARLRRLDMGEFQGAAAAARLVGAGGTPGLLVSAVRQEPFGVLLCDEIEKAHPLVFDLLLQALGDGRLTDADGRVADFSGTVVVLTSNLGAVAAAREPLGFATSTETDAETAVARRLATATRTAVEEHFRPEFVNRLDAVVPFLPLGTATAMALAERECAAFAGRAGWAGWRLDRDDAALRRAVATGLDPAHGARPLRRRLERAVLVPLAGQRLPAGTVVTLRAGSDGGLELSAPRLGLGAPASAAELAAWSAEEVPADGEPVAPAPAAAKAGPRIPAFASAWQGLTATSDLPLEDRAAALRRVVDRLERMPLVASLRAELTRLTPRRRKKRPPPQPADPRRLALLSGLRERLHDLARRSAHCEELAVLGGLAAETPEALPLAGADTAETAAELDTLQDAIGGLLADLLAWQLPDPHAVAIHLVGEGPRARTVLAQALVEAVAAVVRAAGHQPGTAIVRHSWLQSPEGKAKEKGEAKGKGETVTRPVEPYHRVAGVHEQAVALTIEVRAPLARARFAALAGRWLVPLADETERGGGLARGGSGLALVAVTPVEAAGCEPPWQPPAGCHRSGFLRGTASDHQLARDPAQRAAALAAQLAAAWEHLLFVLLPHDELPAELLVAPRPVKPRGKTKGVAADAPQRRRK